LAFEITPIRQLVLGSSARVIWLLFIGTHCLLVIVIIYIANLLAARSVASYDSHVLRMALGATRARLLREHVTDHVLFAIPACLVGLGIAAAALRVFHVMGGLEISRAELAEIGARACLYAASLSLLTLTVSTLLSLAPVVFTARLPTARGALAMDSQIGMVRMGGLQRASVIVQLSLAMILVVMAASGVKLLVHLHHLPLGFEARDLVAVAFESAPSDSASLARSYAFFHSLLGDIRQLPGVEGVAMASFAPLAGALVVPSLPIQDRLGEWTRTSVVKLQTVSADYFGVLRIPLVAGQGFGDEHDQAGPCVAIANESFAVLLGGPKAAIGRVLSANGATGEMAHRCSISGVVGDVRDVGVEEQPAPAVYFLDKQRPDENRTLLIRTAHGTRIVPLLRAMVSTSDPSRRIRSVATVMQYVEGSTQRPRLLSYQILFFAIVGYMISLMGAFGVVDYFVGERRTEIGIRLALGAERLTILRVVAREFAPAAGLGAALGALLSYGASRASSAWISELSPVASPGWSFMVGLLGVSVLVAAAWPIVTLRTADVSGLLRHE
jgi:predicted permease